MSAPLSLAQWRERLEPRLAAFFQEQTLAAAKVDPLYAELVAELGTFVGRGGKRLRPYLSYLAYQGYQGSDEALIAQVSLVSELIHAFALIHDDVIDRDYKRWGGLNVAGVYRQRFARLEGAADHVGSSVAIVAGDLMFNFAHQIVLEAPLEPVQQLAVLRQVRQMVFAVSGGELMDILAPHVPLSTITPERLIQICEYKTASYSFDGPLALGARLAGANEQQLEALTQFAKPLGVAFQLSDDVLGMYGNEDEMGKSVLSDLREGKRTVLIMAALEMSEAAERAQIQTILGNPRASYSHLGTLRELVERCGAKAYTSKLARNYVQRALAVLPSTGLSHPVEVVLQEIATLSVERTH